MGKRIIAVNAGPRMGWNTETKSAANIIFIEKRRSYPPSLQKLTLL